HAIVVGVGRRLGRRIRNRAVESPAQAQRYHGVEGAFVDTVEFAQITTDGDHVADVVAEAGTQVYTGFVVSGACGVVGNGVAHAEFSMASTHGNVWVPGFVGAGKVIGAVQAEFFKFGFACDVFAVCIEIGRASCRERVADMLVVGSYDEENDTI